MMLYEPFARGSYEYRYLQNNGQKTKWLIQITENSRYGSDQRERVINPELFGLDEINKLNVWKEEVMTVYLGRRIRQFRQNKGLTQFELERRTGIKREYLSKIENDELNNPTFFTLLKICDGLGISLVELLAESLVGLPSRNEPKINILLPNSENLDISDKLNTDNYVAVPIIAAELAACNPMFLSSADVQDYALINSKYLEPDPDQHRYRCIWVDQDESMSPVIKNNTLVCIDTYQRTPQKLGKKLAAFRDNQHKVTIRYIRVEGNHILGIPENIRDYSPLIISANKSGRILGEVVFVQSGTLNQKG